MKRLYLKLNCGKGVEEQSAMYLGVLQLLQQRQSCRRIIFLQFVALTQLVLVLDLLCVFRAP
jgi:hypothetical protein